MQRYDKPGNLDGAIAEYQAAIPAGLAAFRAQQAGESVDQEALRKFGDRAQQFDALANMAYPLVVPPADPVTDRHAWLNALPTKPDLPRETQFDLAILSARALAIGGRRNDARKKCCEYSVGALVMLDRLVT